MKIIKNSLYLTLLLAFTLILIHIAWIPSMLINVLLNILIFVLFMGIIKLGYDLVMLIREKNNKALWATLISGSTITLIISYVLLAYVSWALLPDKLLKEYHFGKKVFYLYDTGFMERVIEVSERKSALPIRSKILTNIKNHPNLTLKIKDEKLYIQDGNFSKNISNLLNLKD